MPSKRMLINATQPEELRVALVDGQRLFDLDIESPGREQKKGNIYLARIERFEPSLEALFVNFGSDRHGFLPIREIAHNYFANEGVDELNRANIKDILPEGRVLLIQVDKEERGNKGAALTTFISLAGCYLVLMPNNPRAGGISRRIEGDDRAELREVLNALDIPEGMGIIIRTAGVGRRLADLQWDLGVLLSQWKAIQEAAQTRSAPSLIHQEGNVVIRSVRDYLRPDIEEILVDHREIYENIRTYIEMVRPDFLNRVKFYQDSIPLFNRYQIESQIESAFRRTVQLPSGGALVIDHTEALVSIDINSARATRGGDIEETAYHTNLEAADEIARQLRLRDIGGLIVIDFIDMVSPRNQRMVETRLREAVEMDRARIQIGRISRFGLLEMSRQRLRPVLGESSRIPCPQCEGQGSIRGVDSQALIVLRVLEEEAIKENTAEVRVELPVDVATYMMNEKRHSILHIEKRHNIKILIIPNAKYINPHYYVERLKTDEVASRMVEPASYTLAGEPERQREPAKDRGRESMQQRQAIPQQEPAVRASMPHLPAPPNKQPSTGILKRFIGSLFGASESESESKANGQATGSAFGSATSASPSASSSSTSYQPGTQSSGRRPPSSQGMRRTGDRSQQRPQQRRQGPGQGQGVGQGQGAAQGSWDERRGEGTRGRGPQQKRRMPPGRDQNRDQGRGQPPRRPDQRQQGQGQDGGYGGQRGQRPQHPHHPHHHQRDPHYQDHSQDHSSTPIHHDHPMHADQPLHGEHMQHSHDQRERHDRHEGHDRHERHDHRQDREATHGHRSAPDRHRQYGPSSEQKEHTFFETHEPHERHGSHERAHERFDERSQVKEPHFDSFEERSHRQSQQSQTETRSSEHKSEHREFAHPHSDTVTEMNGTSEAKQSDSGVEQGQQPRQEGYVKQREHGGRGGRYPSGRRRHLSHGRGGHPARRHQEGQPENRPFERDQFERDQRDPGRDPGQGSDTMPEQRMPEQKMPEQPPQLDHTTHDHHRSQERHDHQNNRSHTESHTHMNNDHSEDGERNTKIKGSEPKTNQEPIIFIHSTNTETRE